MTTQFDTLDPLSDIVLALQDYWTEWLDTNHPNHTVEFPPRMACVLMVITRSQTFKSHIYDKYPRSGFRRIYVWLNEEDTLIRVKDHNSNWIDSMGRYIPHIEHNAIQQVQASLENCL